MTLINAVNEFLDDLRGGRMSEAPVVRVEQGELQGKVVTNPSGKAFFSFQGIPYAKPPLGSLRFKAPQPPEPWNGVRDATSEGNVSAQIDPITKQYIGDENCLFLNVYTPNLDGEFLPVMIFIHGGGFKFGSGSSSLYGGDYLVERDVVVVTINYRCGALGFLSLNTPEVPGNAGLKDMVQAIKWVKDNIQNFGGNSGNITIFGESCGGAAVSILTASPLTKNLISKAIIQSGTALHSWSFQKKPIECARNLAKTLGCASEDIDDILDFLSATPVKDIVEATEKINSFDLFIEKGEIVFSAVVEKEFPGVDSVLNEAFVNILTSGRVAEVPVMIGSTTLELFFPLEKINDDLQVWIPKDFHVERDSEEALKIVEGIKSLYFNGRHPSPETINEYFELMSDKLINVDTHRYVQYFLKTSTKPIYLYKFDYVGELNISKEFFFNKELKHAGHMDELGYLFKNDFQKNVTPTSNDLKTRERMLRLWTNFAKTGNPTPDENHYITVTWLPVTKENHYYLNIGNELSLNTDPEKKKMEFWDELYNKYFEIWKQPKENVEEVTRKIESIVISEEEPDYTSTSTTIIESTVEELTETCQIKEELLKNEPETLEETPFKSGNEAEIECVEEEKKVEEPIVQEDSHDVVPERFNGNGFVVDEKPKKPRTSNEIKMVQSNGIPKDVIRANDPPEDDLPKNIGVNKFVNFFESLGGKK